jgi:hypothetical protein
MNFTKFITTSILAIAMAVAIAPKEASAALLDMYYYMPGTLDELAVFDQGIDLLRQDYMNGLTEHDIFVVGYINWNDELILPVYADLRNDNLAIGRQYMTYNYYMQH